MPTELKPQPGPQEAFAKSAADIGIFGGAAGGGKSFSLLLEPLYHADNPRFRAVCFRRTAPQIKQQGGLWDTSEQIYAPLGAEANQTALTWRFSSGAVLQFSGLELESDRFNFQGSQFSLLMFDELTQFTENQFWYLLSRCRSMSGVRSYVRASTNPDPDSFVRRLIDWWLDSATGLAIPERSGVLRWFVRSGDTLVFADSKSELVERFGSGFEPKSLTFVPSSVSDNKILLAADPSYVSNLKALPTVDRERLLHGNWLVRPSAGDYFKRGDFAVVDALPAGRQTVRSWDRAATAPRPGADPDWTRGVKVSRDSSGVFYVEHLASLRARPSEVEKLIVNTASQDGVGVEVLLQHDPGSAGVGEIEFAIRALAGFVVHAERNTASKETRARGASTQSGAGNVKILRGSWNEEFLTELENFPLGSHDDIVDAFSAAINRLAAGSNGAITPADVEAMKLANASSSPGRTWQPRMWNVRQNDFQAGQEWLTGRKIE